MLNEQILNEIKRDVASFADPGTPVTISSSGSLQWTRSRTAHAAQLLRKGLSFPDLRFNGVDLSYQSFLASEALADLKDLAVSILGTIPSVTNYVPGVAQSTQPDGSHTQYRDASDIILRSTTTSEDLPINATRVVFVQGNAGTGKTWSLARAARIQADRYLRGDTSTLLLYLNAQGKGLLELDDVMARALQDLRARFTYHSVAALTRRGCIVPIVDGFDELIGPSSAREAFANLALFLAQLDRDGAVITASRSAFIDYRTLYERAAEIARSQDLSYEILPIEILPWTRDTIVGYCDLVAADTPQVRTQIETLYDSRARELITKPFFLAKAVEMIQAGVVLRGEDDLVSQIVEAALEREETKLKDKRGRILLDRPQHRRFCAALAEEMWSQSQAELDCDTIRLVAEVFADDAGLSREDAKILADRAIAHGLLTPIRGGQIEKRAFEHELFRFEFLAESLSNALRGGTPLLDDFLLRAEIPLEVVVRVPQHGPWEPSDAALALGCLRRITTRIAPNPFVATNAGALTAALCKGRQDLPGALQFAGLYVRAMAFGACQLVGAVFRDCILEGVDLRESALHNCDLETTTLMSCMLSRGTSLTDSIVDPSLCAGLLLVRDDGNQDEIYDPDRIRRLLFELGAAIPEPEAAPPADAQPRQSARIALTERLLKHARTHYYFSEEDTWVRKNLVGSLEWPFVRDCLRRHSLLEEVRIQKSGPPIPMLRLTIAPDIIWQARAVSAARSNTAAVAFWRELSAD